MQKTVLVTGASTGIGFDCVRALIENNFLVIATVRKEKDKLTLIEQFGEKVKVLILDVAQFDQVDQLPEKLKNEFQITELYGLVNNAGVAFAGPFAFEDFEEIKNIINVNVLALMKVTQVLLPLLGLNSGKEGRIVNMSSIAGKFATPFLGVYGASKHAVEGFSHALRRELMMTKIKVSVVAPGAIKTPIWNKGFEKVKEAYAETMFAVPFKRFINLALKQVDIALPVEKVSVCILHAMLSENPKARYAPIPGKFANWYIPHLTPVFLYDKMTAKILKLRS